MGWKPADRIAVALHNFKASTPHHLPIHIGDLLYVLEEMEGGEWFRGYIYYQPSKRGIFPASYVTIKEHTTSKVGSKTFVVPAEDEMGMEAKEALRDWKEKLREFYVNGPRERYRQLLHHMEEVMGWRRTILHGKATMEALQEAKLKLSSTIDHINALLGCPLTPRDETGAAVNYQETSVQQLYKMHQDTRADSTTDSQLTQTLRRKRRNMPHSHLHHLYMRVDSIDHQFPEDCEVFFYLSGGGGEQRSERYLTMVEKGGERRLQAVGKRQSCAFTDLGSKDLQSGIYLVCQIIRKGKMLLDTKKWNSPHAFRRPYACGALDVKGVLGEEEEDGEKTGWEDCQHKMTMPLYLCATNHESNFATFHSTIIQKTGAKGGQKPGCAITLSLRAFHRKELAAVRQEFPILFTKATETVHKLGFPDVIFPGDARNDIYVTLEGGSFDKGTKRAERNVEVAINVVDNTGRTIPRSIILGAGAGAIDEFQSFIFYHNNSPRWNETFKLQIPFNKLPDAHLRIVFRHLAKDEHHEKAEKSFSFAYMRIMKDDGSIIQDGTHELYVYETGNKKWYDPTVYLSQASCKEDVMTQAVRARTAKVLSNATQPAVQVSRSFREAVHVSTLTCSTKLTQRIELLLLLKWRQKSGDLSVILKNVVHVGGEEMVKFLHNTLDCLFDILTENDEKYGELVFEALVAIFGLLSDDRYHHFTTVLDIYIEKHFSAVLAYKFLLASFHRNLRELMLADLQQHKLIKIIKSMPYLFKFIVQSSRLHKKVQMVEDPVFLHNMTQVFQTFNNIMSVQESKLQGMHKVQSAMLDQLPSILPEMAQIFSKEEIAAFLAQLLDAIRNMDNPVIPCAKLTFISSVLQSPVKLLESEATRPQLVPTLVSHLISHMDHRMIRTQYRAEERGNQEVVRCVGQLLGCLSDHCMKCSFDDVQYLVPLMYPLLRLCKELSRHNRLSYPNMVNFLTLLSVMTDKHFAVFFSSQQSYIENTFIAFMLDLMNVLRSYICNPSYPAEWCTLYLMQNKVLARTLQNSSRALVEYALNDTAFSPNIWDHFFGLCTQFMVQECLQLERLSDYRRHQYQQQFGDMRVQIGKHVVVLWHKLGDKKGNFIPNFVKPFLEMTLIRHKELRRASLPLIIDMMKCEEQASSNFKRVETEVFDKMDELIASGWGDEEYRELFRDILHPMCRTHNLGQAGEVFIDCVSRLIGLLLDYRNVSSDEGNKDRRMGCMLNLLNFYREIEKEELYIRYIYKLAALHKKDQSYTEAGFTLLQRAKGLEWSDEPLPPEGRFGTEVERKVKEELYQEVVDLFDRGQAWEHGIPLCKELCKIYEEDFNYDKLAKTLKREAEFFEKIIRELRVEPEYFMVGSYGKGFPLFLRNKIFIHRGQPYERLASFIKRLTDEYPTAELLKNVKPPEAEVMNSSGMYLQVRSVQTIPEEQERFKGKTVPDAVSRYFKANNVHKFRYDRPFHRGVKRKDCEIATLWIERTTFHTAHSFPGEMAWFEVSSLEEVELDPLAIAIETVSSKIEDIKTLTVQHTENRTLNINPLSMLLNGVIDAAVGGGIKNYRVVFFTDEYMSQHPDDIERVATLKDLIEKQVDVLRKGLDLHGQRIAPSLRGMQNNLEEKLEMMNHEVFPERRKPTRSQTVKNAPLPLTPLQASTLKHTQTMVGKRRPTGVNKNRVSQSVETSPSPLKRSQTTKVSNRDPPKPPSPYQRRKSEAAVTEENTRPGSLDGTVGVISEADEDLDRDTYERVEDFIGAFSPSTPGGPPPTYPAPKPPLEGDGPMDHDYTPVKVEEGGVTIPAPPTEEVWAPLPLKTAPKQGKRSISVTTHDGSPKQRERSPSLPPVHSNPETVISGMRHGTLSASKLILPPEPTSPPPSPPVSGRGMTTPPTSRRAAPEPTSSPPRNGAEDQEQPVLPPKKRRDMSKIYAELEAHKSKGSPPRVAAPIQEEIYSFDKLTPPPGHTGPPSPGRQATPPAKQTTLSGRQPQEEVYFDRLSVSPGKATPKASTGGSVSPSSGSGGGDDEVYFDHLAEPLPGKRHPPPPPHPQPLPKPEDDDSVYFDHLAGPLGTGNKPVSSPTKSPSPPPVPLKRTKTLRQTSEETGTPPKSEPARPVPRPRTSTLDRKPSPVPRTSPSREISPSSTPSTSTPTSNNTSPPPPVLPPKPAAPYVPPKPTPPKVMAKPVVPPRDTDIKPPPRPAKTKTVAEK